MGHCAIARFVVKQLLVYDCTDLLCSWDIQCWMLLKDSVFCLLRTNKTKCSLKTRVSLILAYWTLKTGSGSSHKNDLIVVTSFIRTPLYYGHFALSLRCSYYRGSTYTAAASMSYGRMLIRKKCKQWRQERLAYFQLSSHCFIQWWNTASHAWYITYYISCQHWSLRL